MSIRNEANTDTYHHPRCICTIAAYLEGEKNILIGKAESVRNDYKKAIKIHIEKLEKLISSYSWKYILDNSDQDASISLQNICNTLTYSNNTEFRT